MTKDEALKMAIEAMSSAYSNHGLMLQSNPAQDAWLYHGCDAKLFKALQACKEALEQPSQKPVGWMDSEGRFRLDFRTEIVRNIAAVNKEIPLYTHPAPSWQGLSNDRIREIGDNCLENNNGLFNWIDFARAIEQALKEKNT